MDLDIKQIRKWGKEQTAAEMRYGSANSTVEEHLLEQCVDPDKHDSPTFYLYYFAKDLSYLRPNEVGEKPVDGRTILFISGGPGQVNRPGSSNFGDVPGYRIVYFHLRGAGFSQLPASNYYDRFLRTRYAVEDIEAIRKDLLGETPWTAVIGHSYGTVLAQQYAAKYGSKDKNKVGKLILSAPLSQHKIFDETLHFESLKNLYSSKFFDFLPKLSGLTGNALIGHTIAGEALKISKRAEDEFGSLHFLTEIYDFLQRRRRRTDLDRFESLLRDKELHYSLGFFKALRRLRQTGWLSHDENLAKGSSENVDTVQRLAGLLIAHAILTRQPYSCDTDEFRTRLHDLLGSNDEMPKDIAMQIKIAEEYFKSGHVNTPRAYYVFTIYDGLNETFMRTIEEGEKDRHAAIRSLGGEQSDMNEALNKIAVENDAINNWDPKKYEHAVPTLILKGGADPVTEGGQAEYVFDKALAGDRALIEFPGVGHSMSLPRLIEKDTNGNTTSKNTIEYLLEEFVSHDFKQLERVVLPKLQRAFDEPLKKMSKEGLAEAGGLKVNARFKYQ